MALVDGGLVVTVYGPLGPHTPGKPHGGATTPLVTVGVAQRSRHGQPLWESLVNAFGCADETEKPAEPWCAVALHPGLSAYPDASDWLGDFERCIAWAWITRNTQIDVV